MLRGKHNPKPNGKGEIRLGWRFVLFAALLSLLLGAILVVPFLPGAVGAEVRVGFPAPYSVKSPVTTGYVSAILTRSDQDAAVATIGDVYRFDPSITVQQQRALSDTLDLIENVLFNPGLSKEERQERLLNLRGVEASTPTLNLLLILQRTEWQAVAAEALRLYDEVTRDPLDPQRIRQIDAEVVATIWPSLVSRVESNFYPAKRVLVAELVYPFLAANYLVDAQETERRRQEAKVTTPPHPVKILEGELILQEGQIVRDTDVEKLEAAGLRSPAISWQDTSGQVALVVALVAAYSVLLYRFRADVAVRTRRLLLIGLVLVVATLAAKLLVPGRVGFAYAFPLSTAAMLLTLLLGPQVALGGTFVLAVLMGLLAGGSLELAVMGMAGGLIATLGIWRAQRSSAFLFTGFYVSATNLAVLVAFRLMARDVGLSVLLKDGTACVIHGFFSAALAFATFGFLGTLFGQVTVLQLMELSNPNHPLLRRLMQEAPGTYYHSIIVGNLAERAAELVGADPLLVRVGAYFHDVGKVARPYFFVDNQAGRTNIHDELPPRTSAQIITDHVRDGLALARKYRLPEGIAQFIPQHHGTALAGYFYRRALQEDETVNQADFRYPGPKPQSKEAAVLMLADSVEATVRTASQTGKLKEMLEDISEEDGALARLVSGIIEERVRDGQLDECDLTFRDLSTIQRAFVEILLGIYHPRIDYPRLGKPQEAAR